jgi:hypothetical protein
MRNYLEELLGWLDGQRAAEERLVVYYSGEKTEFIRFNQGRVRQGGQVLQAELLLKLVIGAKQVGLELNITGQKAIDQEQILKGLAELRAAITLVSDDPHMLVGWDEPGLVREEPAGELEPGRIIEEIVEGAEGLDLVGIFGGGPIQRGFWALGGSTRHWFSSPSLYLDWSLHLPGNRAIKQLWGGSVWDGIEVKNRIAQGREQLEKMKRSERKLTPGGYRVWLSPSAMAELFSLVGMGFSARAIETRNTPWLSLVEGGCLDRRVSLWEGTQTGLGPAFQVDGFGKPDQVKLVEEGKLVGKLVSPRSALEYKIPANGAAEWEAPEALVMGGGELENELEALGEGLFVGNLWYTNISDRSTGRVTGLTRFGTFWVEEGRIQGPVSTMRFDDTLQRMLGSELLGVGKTVDCLPSVDSWGMRSTSCQRLPGILVGDWKITL